MSKQAAAHPGMAQTPIYIGRDKVTQEKLNDYIDNKYKTWDSRDEDLRQRYYGDFLPKHDRTTAQPAPSVGVARPGSAFSGSPAGAANNAAGGAAAMSGAEPSLSGGPAPVAAPQPVAPPKLSPG